MHAQIMRQARTTGERVGGRVHDGPTRRRVVHTIVRRRVRTRRADILPQGRRVDRRMPAAVMRRLTAREWGDGKLRHGLGPRSSVSIRLRRWLSRDRGHNLRVWPSSTVYVCAPVLLGPHRRPGPPRLLDRAGPRPVVRAGVSAGARRIIGHALRLRVAVGRPMPPERLRDAAVHPQRLPGDVRGDSGARSDVHPGVRRGIHTVRADVVRVWPNEPPPVHSQPMRRHGPRERHFVGRLSTHA